MMNRRRFVFGSSATLALLASSSSGCTQVVTREDVLRQLVLTVVAPEIRALPKSSVALVEALRRWSDTQGLESARSALRSCLLSWQRTQAFRSGPLVESNALLRSTFWPSRRNTIAGAIEGSAPVDATLVENLGVDAKGLYALELILCDERSSEWHTGARAARTRSLAVAFAEDVVRRAATANEQLADGRKFADAFAAGGQASLDKLVNQMVETSETVAADRLLRVLGLQEHDRLLPEQIPGGYSGLSTQLPLAWLKATQQLYLGAGQSGLCTLVKQAAPAIDVRLRTAFDTAVQAIEQLKVPLEQVVQQDRARLQDVAAKARALEIALKSDLAASLGVTLSIVSGDGD